MKRFYASLILCVVAAALTAGSGFGQAGDLQSQADALEQRIAAAQDAWEKAFASIKQYSTADMPKWNALVDARSKELERLRDLRARLTQQANDSFATQARDLNAQIRQFKTAKAVAASSIDFLNNVAQYRTRKQFEDNLDPMARDWERKYGSTIRGSDPAMLAKIDEGFRKYFPDGKETGYRRVGNINPYTGEYYYKFYDKDGEWKFSVWSDAAKGWKRYQEDLQAEWRRHQDDRTDYLRRARDFQKVSDRLDDADAKTAQQLARLSKFRDGTGRRDATNGKFVVQMRMNTDRGWTEWLNSAFVASPYNDGQFNKERYARKSYDTVAEARAALQQQDYHRRADAPKIRSWPYQLRIVDSTGKVVP